ncbi:MAG TPA: hypothetical protein DCL61_16765 [Cyanobacteria bacterium UBA12227]|nr:hypothetical protein [Cyanobacteria bacterium UBA12227]
MEKLINKITDSLLILSSVWSGSIQGQKICAELPIFCHTFPIQPQKIKIVVVLKITSTHLKPELSPLKTRLLDKLRGRLQLFDITNVTLVDHETAAKMGIAIVSV